MDSFLCLDYGVDGDGQGSVRGLGTRRRQDAVQAPAQLALAWLLMVSIVLPAFFVFRGRAVIEAVIEFAEDSD